MTQRPWRSPARLAAVSLAAVLVSACTAQTGSTSRVETAPSADSPGAASTSSRPADDSSESPNATELPALTALDRLLPDDVVDQYVPSLSLTSTVSDTGTDGAFPVLEKVRPRECAPLIQLFSTPVDDQTGNIIEWAWSDVYQGGYAMSSNQTLLVMESDQVAAETFASAVDVLGDCSDASGAWPQTGTIIMDDGLNYKRFSIGNVEEVQENAYILQERPLYDGAIPSLNGIALRDNIIVSLHMSPDSNMTARRSVEVFSRHLTDAINFAIGGTGAIVSDTAQQPTRAPDTLDCLVPRSSVLEILDPYSSVMGPGFGTDIFVKTPISVTNTCTQDVKSFDYEQTFSTAKQDDFTTGYGSAQLKVAVGKTRQTESNIGYVVYSIDRGYPIFAKVAANDVVVDTAITQIVFTNGESIP